MVVKMIWGTRYGNPEKHLTQKNILGYIQKTSKHPNAKEVQDKYDFLYDIAHPSFIGNTRYSSHIRQINTDGSESRVIEKHSKGDPVKDILDNVLWALGWSAAVIRNSFHITTHGLKQLLEKINQGEQTD